MQADPYQLKNLRRQTSASVLLALELREAIQAGFSEKEAETFRRMLLRVIANVDRLEKNASAVAVRRAASRGIE